MLKPKKDKTFSGYANTFNTYVTAQLQNVTRVDIVWDECQETNLKAATRRKHDQGVRQRVVPENELPRNWSEFLRDGHNKEELFRLPVAEYTTTSASHEKNSCSLPFRSNNNNNNNN